AISVNYATANFTAVAGTHYSATSGTLNFPPGVVSQSFSVPLLDNPSQDGDLQFSVVLSGANPTNTLGFPQSVLVTILDDELHNEPAGSPDTSFDPNTTFNGDVFALALQADGRILAAGDFTLASVVA